MDWNPLNLQRNLYTIEDAQFLPPTHQTARIPIWIAGVWPGTRPFRRAARWDGIIPTGRNGSPNPDEIRQMLAYINNY
jgi:alkanesulfonate monooxygenase SsuD/methylene tetrahydromethanopterin reductase-like flavin-dependent oxidoreductase (luciferase family)